MNRRVNQPPKPILAEPQSSIDTSRLWIPWVNVVAGLWLIASVFVFIIPSQAAIFNAVVTGTVIVITAGSIWVAGYFYRAMIWERLSWFSVVLGLWTIVTTFIFTTPIVPEINQVIVGIVVVAVSLANWLLNWQFCQACRLQR